MSNTNQSDIKNIILISVFLMLVGIITIIFMEDDLPSSPTPWGYATPEEQGFDSVVLVELLQRIKMENLDIHSIILMRNNRVFLEFYSYPYGPSTLQHTMSVGKSITSALVGIALEEGLISSLETPIINSFPEYLPSITEPRKLTITLRHALNMTTGLDIGDDNAFVLSAIGESESWLKASLAQNMTHAPGESFNYASFVSHLIAQVVQRAVGEELMSYAQKKLFEPIGMGKIQAIQIERDPEGNWFGAGGLWMTPQDMLRFGMLYLRKGRWYDKQIVPRKWVQESTRNQIGEMRASANGTLYDKYGYQWWIFDEAYAAMGVGGQQIFIIPALDFVAVITRANPKLQIMDDYIIKALKSPYWAAKPNPISLEQLNSLVTELSKPRSLPPIQLPKIANQISGKRYQFVPVQTQMVTENIDYQAFSLHFDQVTKKHTFVVEKEGDIIKFNLGSKYAPAFSNIVKGGKRPDGKNQYAATMEWLNEHLLKLDFHEIGYPIKQHWLIDFSENHAEVTINSRGASHQIRNVIAKSIISKDHH